MLGSRRDRSIYESRSKLTQGMLKAREALGSAANVRRYDKILFRTNLFVETDA